MGKAPERNITVYFLGAGTSMAFGLPSTAGLLKEIHRPGSTTGFSKLVKDLPFAYEALYPDGALTGFIPNTVDFFSSLKAYIDVAPHMRVPSIPNAVALMQSLKKAIQQILIEKQREIEVNPRFSNSAYLQEVVKPGSVVITTNWDLMIERYAAHNGVDVAWKGSHDPKRLLLLKLHGSIDWCSTSDKAVGTKSSDFRAIDSGSKPESYCRATITQDVVAADNLRRVPTLIKSPLMVAMYSGKGVELEQLSSIWSNAYAALAKAKELHVDGYSMPADDMEVRTLARAGILRGRQAVSLTVRNPDSEAHMRIRHFLGGSTFTSDYSPL